MIPEKIKTLLRSNVLADNIIGMEILANTVSVKDIEVCCRKNEVGDLYRDEMPYILLRISRDDSVILSRASLFLYPDNEMLATGEGYQFIEYRINHKDLTL